MIINNALWPQFTVLGAISVRLCMATGSGMQLLCVVGWSTFPDARGSAPAGALTGAATEARELLSPHLRSGLATTAGRPPPAATAAPVAATVSHMAPGRSAGAASRVAGALGTADGGGASFHLTAAAATTSITDTSR